MPHVPSLPEFEAAARSAEVVPVFRRLLADRLTPVSAFELLERGSLHAFLLESVVGGEKIGRYSFIATNPRSVFAAAAGRVLLREGEAETRFTTTDPLADLQRLLGKGRFHRRPELPAFTGGLVGYAGYDAVRYYEPDKLGPGPADDRQLPDVLFGLYDELVVFDHVAKTLYVVANAHPAEHATVADAYADATARVDTLVVKLSETSSLAVADIHAADASRLDVEANRTQADYEQAVRTGQAFIHAGDIFQFVPSLRLRARSGAPPLNVYRALRVINPSPFMFYLKSPACTLIGSSPEILCRVQAGQITTRPLAGTRRRGRTPDEDLALEKELLADPKERAEHVMLVDLHRNDIGRVSRVGSVTVNEAMAVERYSHVMHITSEVTGELRPEFSALDALRVSLPVGTVSGAPKVRAMQIIDEAEPTRRGPYAGAVGYADFAGDLDTCIALRTIVYRPTDGGIYDVQAGAGVVADSIPASEYDECYNKARAMLGAIAMADAGM